MCQQRFVPAILSGAKPHTIRAGLATRFKRGEVVSLRYWSGKPYRSKQVEFARVEILREDEIRIGLFHRKIHMRDDAWPITNRRAEKLARDDGFADLTEMLVWFNDTHGIPFKGRLIQWKLCAFAPSREVAS